MIAPLSNNSWTMLLCLFLAAQSKAESPYYTNNKQTQIIITTRNYNDQTSKLTNKQTIDNEKKKSNNETIPKTNPKI